MSERRSNPQPGEYWRNPDPYGHGDSFHYPGQAHLVEQVGVTTIWLQTDSGRRIHMSLPEVRDTWERCAKPAPPPSPPYAWWD